MARTTRSAVQSEFGFVNWGGKRRGAGRRPKGGKAGVSHAKRPELREHFPVHVTLRLEKGLPSLRRKEAYRVLKRAFGAGAVRFGFRLVHFSVLSNHLHLLLEARDGRALSRGMLGLSVRMARALNRLWKRSGSVFADRFHSRLLKTPREVRNALVYVLQNARKHTPSFSRRPDAYSSGPWFDGWKPNVEKIAESSSGFLARARTWLLGVGWRRHGLIDPLELPSSA